MFLDGSLKCLSYFQKDVFSFLKNSNSYDLIYADPPYGMYDPNKLVEEVFKHLNKSPPESLLKILFFLEERYKNFFTKNFQYPMIILKKK